MAGAQWLPLADCKLNCSASNFAEFVQPSELLHRAFRSATFDIKLICKWAHVSMKQSEFISQFSHTAAVKSLLTVRVLLQQKPESECCA